MVQTNSQRPTAPRGSADVISALYEIVSRSCTTQIDDETEYQR